MCTVLRTQLGRIGEGAADVNIDQMRNTCDEAGIKGAIFFGARISGLVPFTVCSFSTLLPKNTAAWHARARSRLAAK